MSYLKIENVDKLSVPIIGEGLLGCKGVDEGKLIPVVLLDCDKRPDLGHLIENHKHFPPGDVVCRWGLPVLRNKWVSLVLEFVKPIEVSIILNFDLPEKSSLVDKIVQTRSLMIQRGVIGEKLSDTIGNDRILLDIPKLDFDDKWEKILRKIIKKNIKKGHIGGSIDAAVNQVLKEWRSLDKWRHSL